MDGTSAQKRETTKPREIHESDYYEVTIWYQAISENPNIVYTKTLKVQEHHRKQQFAISVLPTIPTSAVLQQKLNDMIAPTWYQKFCWGVFALVAPFCWCWAIKCIWKLKDSSETELVAALWRDLEVLFLTSLVSSCCYGHLNAMDIIKECLRGDSTRMEPSELSQGFLDYSQSGGFKLQDGHDDRMMHPNPQS